MTRHSFQYMLALLMFAGSCANRAEQTSDHDACKSEKCDNPFAEQDGPQYARFANAPLTACSNPAEVGHFGGCIPGILPPNDELALAYRTMNASERRGLAAWHLFSGDGRFSRFGTLDSKGAVNLLRMVDNRELDRNERFEILGTLNDPGCRPPSGADGFGLTLDECDDPFSSGILGVRLRPNPAFDEASWSSIGGARGHFADPGQDFELPSGRTVKGWEVEPPYLPAITCTLCHAAPDPLNPPRNLDEPRWDEVVFALGNQYLSEGALFGHFYPHDDFAREVLMSQPRGTSDTSRLATDHIFNPGTINSIANLRARPLYKERATPGTYNPDRIPCDLELPPTAGDLIDLLNQVARGEAPDPRDPSGQCVPTLRVLKMGGDSSGPTGAVLRVFVNTGSCVDYFYSAAGDFGNGLFGQQPVDRFALHAECEEYRDLEGRAIDLFNYLAFVKPYKLEEAPFGAELLERGLEQVVRDHPFRFGSAHEVLERGAMVFAEQCATCHSSVQPYDPWFREDDPRTWFTEERKAFFRELVTRPEFLAENFLADDRRYSVALLGTNAARAFATNAGAGRIWAPYSSEDFKGMPPVDLPKVSLEILGKRVEIGRTGLAGGRGYYRTPSLVNAWTSAPWLHNNGLGLYNGDPSVAGRLEAYEDAMRQLLNPGLRLGELTVRRTSGLSKLHTGISLPVIGEVVVPVPAGSPIDWRANIGVAIGRGEDVVDVRDLFASAERVVINFGEFLKATDPVQDKGHEFGSDLSDADKRALVEFIKRM